MIDIKKIPDNPEELKTLIISQQQEIKSYRKENSSLSEKVSNLNEEVSNLNEEVSNLNDLVRLLRMQHFAPKSEVISSEQLHLFNEAEIAAVEDPVGDENKTEVKGHKRGKPKRKPFPDFIPREEVIIEIPEEDRKCPNDGHTMEPIGEEVSEKLDIIPAQMKVIVTKRIKYGCKCCKEGVITAPVQPQAIPKGIPTAGLLAFIATYKYLLGMPLYRIAGIFERCKIEISRGTMASWMIRVGELLTPIYNLLEEDLLSGSYVCCDETTVQVLKEENKKPTTKSYMWVRGRDGPGGPPVVLFEYDPTRSGKVPERLMQGFKGYMQVDGYNGYGPVCRSKDIIRVGCWSHVHRKFVDAFKASKKGKGNSQKAIIFIKQLYKIEEKIKNQTAEERYNARQKYAKPILEEMKEWMNSIIHSVLPKSLLGEALQYTYSEWANIIRYIEDGNLRIDNNFIERAIRPFAIGRKNWLFSDSVAGAKASSMIYSIIETSKINGHDPYYYLRHVLQELPKAATLADFEILLPYNLKPDSIQV